MYIPLNIIGFGKVGFYSYRLSDSVFEHTKSRPFIKKLIYITTFVWPKNTNYDQRGIRDSGDFKKF